MLARRQALARDGYQCRACGQIVHGRRAHVDHITPKAQGGSDLLENLQTLCQPCHVAKTRAYTEALMRLREAHPAEFQWLLEGCYAEAEEDMPERQAAPDPQISLW